MNELEEGVFDLGWQEPFTLSAENTQAMLQIYGDGIERAIMSVIFGFSGRYGKWVGVTCAKLLSVIVSFDGPRLGIKAEERERIQALALATGTKMRDAIPKMVAAKYLRTIEHEAQNNICCPFVRVT